MTSFRSGASALSSSRDNRLSGPRPRKLRWDAGATANRNQAWSLSWPGGDTERVDQDRRHGERQIPQYDSWAMPVMLMKWRGSTVSRSDRHTLPAVQNWLTVSTIRLLRPSEPGTRRRIRTSV